MVKVKIGRKIYSSEAQPIMMILTREEKRLIGNMRESDYRFCSFPGKYKTEKERDAALKQIKEFMKTPNQ